MKGHIGANQVRTFVFIKAILLRFVSFATKWLHSGGVKGGERTDTVVLCVTGALVKLRGPSGAGVFVLLVEQW